MNMKEPTKNTTNNPKPKATLGAEIVFDEKTPNCATSMKVKTDKRLFSFFIESNENICFTFFKV